MRALVVAGTTATGKTALALSLAKRFHGELVSADSRQIYQGLRVLSGQDVPPGVRHVFCKEVIHKSHRYPLVTYAIEGIPVWLYDALTPSQPCNISLYRALALEAVRDITARGKLPIIVGGAGLYIDAIFLPPETIDIPVNAALRHRLTLVPVPLLQKQLQDIDAAKYGRMNNSDRNNPRRLVRALEVAVWQQRHPHVKPSGQESVEGLWIGLTRDSDELSSRIASRVDKRWHGAIEEVKRIRALASFAVRTSLGVAEITAYLDGALSEREAKEQWTRNEHAYALRQLRWFKKRQYIYWYNAASEDTQRLVVERVSGWYTK